VKRTGRICLLLAFLVVFCGTFFLSNLHRPLLNWDMVAYVASAKAYQTHDPAALQTEVYELLRRSVPQRTYSDLTTGYLRHLRATDPESFRQHLPFFQIRVAYVWAILALWTFGLNPFFASYLISAICAALAIMVLAFILPRQPLVYSLVVPFIALSSAFPDLARYSTPDAMAALAVLVCYALAFRRHKLLLIALPACVAVRTDLLLLLPSFYVFLWLTRPFASRLVLASALSSVALYWGLNAIFGNYGWSTVFDYTFSHQSAYPADYPHAVTVKSYLAALASGVGSVENGPRLLKYVGVSIAGIAALLWRPHWIRRAVGPMSAPLQFALVSSLVYVGLHFMLFPAMWGRYFAAQYALAFSLAAYIALEAVLASDLARKIRSWPSARIRANR